MTCSGASRQLVLKRIPFWSCAQSLRCIPLRGIPPILKYDLHMLHRCSLVNALTQRVGDCHTHTLSSVDNSTSLLSLFSLFLLPLLCSLSPSLYGSFVFPHLSQAFSPLLLWFPSFLPLDFFLPSWRWSPLDHEQREHLPDWLTSQVAAFSPFFTPFSHFGNSSMDRSLNLQQGLADRAQAATCMH